MSQGETLITRTAEIVPLRTRQGMVTEARDIETRASVWLVSVMVDGGDLISRKP